MTDEIKTLAERIAEDGITLISATRAPVPEGWDPASFSYMLTLEFNGETYDGPMTFGPGNEDRIKAGAEPNARSFLSCLISDAAGVENADGFEDWCSEYDYDTDSRKAFATYEACEEVNKDLKEFLGDHYDDYLWRTEAE